MDACILVDRGTWLSFGNRGDPDPLVERDPDFFSRYAVIADNPEFCPVCVTRQRRPSSSG